jgi:hypothetical protein
VLGDVRRALVASLCVLFVACGGALGEGKSDFKKGRYAEAKETFARIEVESKGWDDGRRAQYALYRGLTHSALGDRAAAGVWLREAEAICEKAPSALDGEDLARLRLGLESLGPAGDTGP